jgi:hypothetical protein
VVVEVGTELFLMINPEIVVALLLGVRHPLSSAAETSGRCFGIALLALGHYGQEAIRANHRKQPDAV